MPSPNEGQGWTLLSPATPKFLGMWNATISYRVADVVLHNSTLWYCQAQNNNIPPTEGSYWALFLPRGEQGVPGTPGPAGVPGTPGPAGFAPYATTVTVNSASIAAGASQTVNAAIANTSIITSVETSAPARVRAYQNAASAAADINRSFNTYPPRAAGIIFDITTGSGINNDGSSVLSQLLWNLNPAPLAINNESPPNSIIPLVITNTGNFPATITVSLKVKILEV